MTQAMPQPRAGITRGFYALLALSFLYFVWRIALDYIKFGNTWKQGDWLINSVNMPVRRSLPGDVFIWISDASGLDLLLVVCAVQVTLAAALYGIVIKLVRGDATLALMLAALSPSFFVLFWVADPQGAARKELLAFVGLGLIVLSLAPRNSLLLVLGSAVFVASVFSHEGMVFFLPVLAMIYLLCLRDLKDWVLLHLCFAAVAVLSVLAFFLASGQSEVLDHTPICDPLTARGLSESLCNGAIRWLEEDLAQAMARVAERADMRLFANLAAGYALAMAPFVYVAWLSDKRAFALTVLLLPALFFVPLYVVAVDHGRWIAFHVFSAFALLAVLLMTGRITLMRAPSTRAFVAFAVIGLVLVHKHTNYLIIGGVLRRLAADAVQFLG